MSNNPELLQKLISLMQNDVAPGFFLNKSFDISKWAEKLLQDIEAKRSSITALTREKAIALGNNKLQFSSTKHESRINCLYRLLGLPSEIDLDNKLTLLDKSGKNITSKDALTKQLLQREYEQLILTFKTFLQSNSLEDLNKQIDSVEESDKKLIAELFDPNIINENRLFPIAQFSKIQSVVEPANKIAPAFASMSERFVNETLMQPPFLESVITIRLLQQSGGAKINTQGAVEDIIIQSLGFALAEIAKQYHRNQADAERHLADGIATIRPKVQGVNSPLIKAGDISAGNRENDNIKTEIDIRNNYTSTQAALYEAAISLLPIENDVIPIDINLNNVAFKARSIKDNALTASFIEIINANVDALQRITNDNKKIIQKRQLSQDKLTAEIGSSIGELGGISLAEIVIIIASLFVLDEQDLVGLLSKSRFDQLVGSSNNNTSTNTSTTSGGTTSSTNETNTQKTINIFEILKQFKDDGKNKRTDTTAAVKILQDVIKTLYIAFKTQLAHAHKL